MRAVLALLAAISLASPAFAYDQTDAVDGSKTGLLSFELGTPYDVKLQPFGYVRIGYEAVQDDDRFDFIGRNDGFVLDNARLGMIASIGEQLSMAISMEAASDIQAGNNQPIGEIDVRLRDGFLRWDPFRFVGIQAGQFKAPFAAEELRSTSDLVFVSRAVGQEGVLPGRGFEEIGVAVDRQLGAMLSSPEPLTIWKKYAGSYYLMVANGNGDNELLNDNDNVAVYGRGELHYDDLLTIGGAFLVNTRTEGELPNQSDDEDTGYAADILMTPFGLEVFFQFVELKTEFETVPEALDRTQRAWHVQVGYDFETPWVNIMPGYRYAVLDPYADVDGATDGLDLEAFKVGYHTIGARFLHPKLPLGFFVNYTFTTEDDPRKLDNNRLQLLAQVAF
jgi:hypothetical protein